MRSERRSNIGLCAFNAITIGKMIIWLVMMMGMVRRRWELLAATRCEGSHRSEALAASQRYMEMLEMLDEE